MLALLQVSVADEVPHIVTVDEGTNVNSCCDILLPRMPHHPIAAGVLCHLIRNLVHNAETHGGGGEVFMAVAATHVAGDKAVLCVTIVNTAGAGHATTLHLQQVHGPNFLLLENATLVGPVIGSKDSTFLGMREISQASALLEASLSITFEEFEFITSVT